MTIYSNFDRYFWGRHHFSCFRQHSSKEQLQLAYADGSCQCTAELFWLKQVKRIDIYEKNAFRVFIFTHDVENIPENAKHHEIKFKMIDDCSTVAYVP